MSDEKPEFAVSFLFPIPLIIMKIETEEVKKIFYEKIFHEKWASRSDKGANITNYFNNSNVLSLFPELENVKKSILDAANFVYRKILNYHNSGDLILVGSWFNLGAKGASQPKHSHQNSILSGTLYIHVDENTDIDFFNPHNKSQGTVNALIDYPSREANDYNYGFHYDFCRIKPEIGHCLFWPSYLPHGFIKNNTAGRLSLSFNLIPSKFNSDYGFFVKE